MHPDIVEERQCSAAKQEGPCIGHCMFSSCCTRLTFAPSPTGLPAWCWLQSAFAPPPLLAAAAARQAVGRTSCPAGGPGFHGLASAWLQQWTGAPADNTARWYRIMMALGSWCVAAHVPCIRQGLPSAPTTAACQHPISHPEIVGACQVVRRCLLVVEGVHPGRRQHLARLLLLVRCQDGGCVDQSRCRQPARILPQLRRPTGQARLPPSGRVVCTVCMQRSTQFSLDCRQALLVQQIVQPTCMAGRPTLVRLGQHGCFALLRLCGCLEQVCVQILSLAQEALRLCLLGRGSGRGGSAQPLRPTSHAMHLRSAPSRRHGC